MDFTTKQLLVSQRDILLWCLNPGLVSGMAFSGGGEAMAQVSPAVIQGTCDPRFEAVRQEFERNFSQRGEVGASVSVTVEGTTVVDLWGGFSDPENGRPWERDTTVVVWSCTKGATAICAHILVSRNGLDLEAPVAAYWPEFAQSGKDGIPVRML